MRALVLLRWLLPGALPLAACNALTGMPDMSVPMNDCHCADSGDVRHAGAVVVRWRIEDATVGRLFPRGQCCCSPQDLDPASPASLACGASGTVCPASPAWLISQVRLRVKPLTADAGVGALHDECVIPSACSDAELTTDFCLSAGDYELQLVATVAALGPGPAAQARFGFSGAEARTAPAVRRTVRPGEIVNLDAVLLGINEPPPARDLGGDL